MGGSGTAPPTGIRSRIVDAALFGLIVIAAAWLGRLVYHNYLGGHTSPEFPGWTIAVPEGTPLREHVVVPLEERTAAAAGGRIAMVEDMVIGDSGDPEAAFYRAGDLAVDAEGRIYVLDTGNHRVQVFDAAGALLRSFGREGQGPGEFLRTEWMVLAGGRLVINDPAVGRLSVWTPEGEHVEDHPHGRRFRPDVVRGAADGTLIAGRALEAWVQGPGPGGGGENAAGVGDAEGGSEGDATQGEPAADSAGDTRTTESSGVNATPSDAGSTAAGSFPSVAISRFGADGEQIAPILEVPIRGLVQLRPGPGIPAAFASGYNDGALQGAGSRPRYAVGRDGGIVLAAGDEYQLLALDPEGRPRWLLRTDLAMPAFPTEDIDRRAARSSRATSPSDYVWDELLPAIDEVRVDGHGHVWVFPTERHLTVLRPEDEPLPETRPVDVFDADGELLYSGIVARADWHVALGDFVYALTTDRESGEQVVIRYRLEEPF